MQKLLRLPKGWEVNAIDHKYPIYVFRRHLHVLVKMKMGFNAFPFLKHKSHSHTYTLSYPRPPNLCPEALVDCVGKPRIFIQCLCLIAPLCGYESALWRTRMVIPNAGRKNADWLSCGCIQCANIQVLITWSITALVRGLCEWRCTYRPRANTRRPWLFILLDRVGLAVCLACPPLIR